MDLLQSIPEPVSLLLLGAALLGVSLAIRRLVQSANQGFNRGTVPNLHTK